MNLLYQINKIWNHFWKHKWSVQLKKVPGWQLAWLKLKYSRKAYFLKVFCWQHAAVLKFRTKLSGLFVSAGYKKKRKTETSSTLAIDLKMTLESEPNSQLPIGLPELKEKPTRRLRGVCRAGRCCIPARRRRRRRRHCWWTERWAATAGGLSGRPAPPRGRPRPSSRNIQSDLPREQKEWHV